MRDESFMILIHNGSHVFSLKLQSNSNGEKTFWKLLISSFLLSFTYQRESGSNAYEVSMYDERKR